MFARPFELIHQLLAREESNEVPARVAGWLRTKRETKELAFLELNDGSCQKNLQVVLDKGQRDWSAELTRLSTGASFQVEGTLRPSPAAGQKWELVAQTLVVVGEADPTVYPLQKKKHSYEFLREIAHLRPRTNTFGAIARIRNTIAMGIHEFFQTYGYVWVNTPLITASDAEGAGQMFRVTTLDLDHPPRTPEGHLDWSRDFFGKEAHLTVSGQLNGETYATALGAIYTFGPTFRAENSNTTRHLAEFWMVEPETAWLDIHGNMDLAEAFLKFLVTRLLERHPEELAFFEQWVQPGLLETLSTVAERPFARITYTQAINVLQNSGKVFDYPVSWGIDLQSEHERYLTDEVYRGPVIVTDYPQAIKAFYMKQNPDGTVRAMDVLVPRLGEIIGGSEREENLEILQVRLDQLGMKRQDYAWYLDLRRFGTVPHSGFGLGFERFLQYVTGMANIRDVIPFPRAAGSAEF
ncbi:MAG: asparagine--tRNA ligase [Spirochaetales bacterium]|nr:asparagine--tRNA ligase [Spirochaetales bacterium]